MAEMAADGDAVTVVQACRWAGVVANWAMYWLAVK